VIGQAADLTYRYDHLGDGPSALVSLADSDSEFAKAFKGAQRPAIIVGQGALTRPDSAAVLAATASLGAAVGVVREGWNGWNVLHAAAARPGGLDLGFVPRAGGKTAREMTARGALDVLFLLGADELDLAASDAFVIYLGTHGDAGAHRADIILPGAAYTEKNGLYVNTEGRVQRGERAVFPKGEAREDWAILRALAGHLGVNLGYDTLDALRERLFADHPTFGRIDFAPGSIPTALDLGALGVAGELGEAPFASAVKAFHLTNPIARASVTMAECAALASGLKLAAE
jgi:NADH-quinone oxidoreductase subunit G